VPRARHFARLFRACPGVRATLFAAFFGAGFAVFGGAAFTRFGDLAAAGLSGFGLAGPRDAVFAGFFGAGFPDLDGAAFSDTRVFAFTGFGVGAGERRTASGAGAAMAGDSPSGAGPRYPHSCLAHTHSTPRRTVFFSITNGAPHDGHGWETGLAGSVNEHFGYRLHPQNERPRRDRFSTISPSPHVGQRTPVGVLGLALPETSLRVPLQSG
jgi:hypothetical protein